MANDTSKLTPKTIAAQALGRIDGETRAIVPPVHVSTTYIRDPDNGYSSGYVYGRPDNATIRQTEDVLNALEGGAGALLFGSGMAAATAVFLALAPGDHVIAPRVMYWGLKFWLTSHFAHWGGLVDFVDMDDLDAVRAAVRPGVTRLIWVETPANPLWTISDLAGIAAIAHGAGALMAVDSTVPTPVLTKPIALGADIVMHAATKYLNGHSDVIAGALVSARDDGFWARIKSVRALNGAILGPLEAMLLLRGMRTLHVRVEAQCRTAQALAEHLCGHPKVAQVLYPGLADFPGHELAARQMRGGFGGMMSIRLRGGEAAAIATAARVQVFKRATSLGGVESLIEHRASIEGPTSPCPPDLLRLSIGLEDGQDLYADLDAAMRG